MFQNNIAHAIVLIEHGADLFAVNKHRETSLHITCRKVSKKVKNLFSLAENQAKNNKKKISHAEKIIKKSKIILSC